MSDAYYEKVARINLTTGEIKVELLDAREYVGVLSEELDDRLKEKHGAECSVLNIGPAGEKQVLLACVMNDKDRAAGRSGVGAVMGSKKLKAIVVKATRKQLDVIADVEALKEANKRALKLLSDNAATGTSWTVEQLLEIGDRIYNIERMFNKAAGMKPEDDRLPKRLLTEPITNGPSKGMLSRLPLTLPEYYATRGWVNAFPTDETLKKLGLDECIGK